MKIIKLAYQNRLFVCHLTWCTEIKTLKWDWLLRNKSGKPCELSEAFPFPQEWCDKETGVSIFKLSEPKTNCAVCVLHSCIQQPNVRPCSRGPALHSWSSLSRERTWETCLVYTITPIGKVRCSSVWILKLYLEQWRFPEGGPDNPPPLNLQFMLLSRQARVPLLLLSTALLGFGKGFSTNKQCNSHKVSEPQFTCYWIWGLRRLKIWWKLWTLYGQLCVFFNTCKILLVFHVPCEP